MAKKCIYCKTGLDDSSVIDVCKPCGLQVWGENMFNTIVQNMEGAREAGDLYQGSVSETPRPELTPNNSLVSNPSKHVQSPQSSKPSGANNPFASLTQEAMATQEQIELEKQQTNF